jgi:hypothetical protein
MKTLITASTAAMAAVTVAVAFPMIASAQPAIVTAAPKPFDTASYNACAGQADVDWLNNKISDQTYKELMRGCCYFAGGKWVSDPTKSAGGYCQPPPKFGIEGPLQNLEQVQPQRPNFADGGSITATVTHDLAEAP